MDININLRLTGKITHVIAFREDEPTLRAIIGPFQERLFVMNPLALKIKAGDRVLVEFPKGEDAVGNVDNLAGPVTVTAADPASLLVSPGDDGATPPNAIPNAFWFESVQKAGVLGDFTATATDGTGTLPIVVTLEVGTEKTLQAIVHDPVPITAPAPAPVHPV